MHVSSEESVSPPSLHAQDPPPHYSLDEASASYQNNLDTIVKQETPQLPRIDDIVEGRVITRKTGAIFVDLGVRGTGIIYGREFFNAHDVLKKLGIGDTIHAKVVDPENHEGYVELSVSAAGRDLAWEAIREAFEKKETIEVTVEAANRGGLMATVQNVKAFLPVSQLAPEHYPRVEGGDKEQILTALRVFTGKRLRVKILNINPAQAKLILSERTVIEEELREELKNYPIGDTVEGVITGIVDFGLFIRLGPDEKFEGLAHISELSWGAIENIREMFHIGQRVKAKIIDLQGERISLSLKALIANPWEKIDERLSPEAHVEGRVTKRIPSGAIVNVEPGIQGIVRNASEELVPGSTHRFRITMISPPEQRMELEIVKNEETGGALSEQILEPTKEPSSA